MSIGILGLGRVGTVFATRFEEAGIQVRAVWDTDSVALERSIRSLQTKPLIGPDMFGQCTVVFLCVQDRFIESAAAELLDTSLFSQPTVLASTSGLFNWDLSVCKHLECITAGTMHPLMAFPSNPEAARCFKGVGFSLRGDLNAVSILKELVTLLGGIPLMIPAEKSALYHAAAVFASNFPVLLHGIATDIFREIGVDECSSSIALSALLDSVRNNMTSEPPRQAFSGPVVRKDLKTIEAHLNALQKDFPQYAGIYSFLNHAARAWLYSDDKPSDKI